MSDASRSLLAALSLLGPLVGCAGAPPVSRPVASAPEVVTRSSEQPALVGSTGTLEPRAREPRVGDRSVRRFSGSYRSAPLLLSEEVVARDGDVLVIDYRVEESEAPLHLRVRRTLGTERVLSVHELRGGVEQPAEDGAFERLLAATSLAPDANEGRVAEEAGTCLIGEADVPCRTTRYAVSVAGRDAVLEVQRSDALALDLGGELVDAGGELLYRAVLLELERGPEVTPLSETESAAALLR